MHIDNTIKRAELTTEDCLCKLLTRDHAAGMPDEHFKHSEFSVGQVKRSALYLGLSRRRVEANIA